MASASLSGVHRDLVREALAPSSASAPSRADFFLHDSGYSFEGSVIFLDVDGVLHPLGGAATFAEPSMAELARIHKVTGAELVLSSTWRESDSTLAVVNQQLAAVGVPPCVSKTVSLLSIDGSRSAEIAQWLDNHPKVTRYVAIDDMDLLDGQRADKIEGHFVHTRSELGLTAPLADLAIRILAGA